MTESEKYDLVVVGGGPLGLSTAYNCAKAGKKVLLLERFVLFNQSGSSAGLIRMFRTMYTEDYTADLAKDSIHLWNELEKEAGVKLREMSGLLNFGDPTYKSGPEGNLKDPIKNLKRLGMKYQELTVHEIMQQLPFKSLPQNFEGLWAPDNGCINVALLVRKLAELSRKRGVIIKEYANVQKVKVDGNDVTVEVTVSSGDSTCTLKTFHAQKCAITTGAYTNHILEPSFGIKLNLDIWEMVYAYYACDPELIYRRSSADRDTIQALEGRPFKCMWFQFAKSDDSDSSDPNRASNLFYGFPSVPWGPPNLARIAVDNAVRRITDPDDRCTNPSAYDIERTRKFVREHTIGVIDQPSFAGTCLQTNLPDNMFVLDYIPKHRNVVVFTGGWGFKFVPLIGLILKQMLFDRFGTKYDISHFKITRPGVIVAGGTDAKPILVLTVFFVFVYLFIIILL